MIRLGPFLTRRPGSHYRPDTAAEQVAHAAEAQRYGVQSFIYRELALAAAERLTGWVTFIQYIGAWDRWVVEARRKSWRGRSKMLRLDGTVG